MFKRFVPLCATTILALGFAGCNSAPIANDDSIATASQKSVEVDVIANDSDEDGDRMMVTKINQPENGSAAIKNDRTLAYTPNAGFSGQDQIEYTISDGDDDHLTAAVLNINVAPAPIDADRSSSSPASSQSDTVIMIPGAPRDTARDNDFAMAPGSKERDAKESGAKDGAKDTDLTLPASTPRGDIDSTGDWKSETVVIAPSAPTLVVRGPFRVKVMTWTSKEPVRFEVGPVDSAPSSALRERVPLRAGQVEYQVPEGKALFAEGEGSLTYSGLKR